MACSVNSIKYVNNKQTILQKPFPKIQGGGNLPKLFYEATITRMPASGNGQMPRSDKDITRK